MRWLSALAFFGCSVAFSAAAQHGGGMGHIGVLGGGGLRSGLPSGALHPGSGFGIHPGGGLPVNIGRSGAGTHQGPHPFGFGSPVPRPGNQHIDSGYPVGYPFISHNPNQNSYGDGRPGFPVYSRPAPTNFGFPIVVPVPVYGLENSFTYDGEADAETLGGNYPSGAAASGVAPFQGQQSYTPQMVDPYAPQGAYLPTPAQPYPPQAQYPYQGQPYPSSSIQGSPPQPYDAGPAGYPVVPPQGTVVTLPAPQREADAITLFFRDGRPPEQVRNYALTRTALLLTGDRMREIPLAELDLPLMERVNHAAGVDFELPEAR